MVAGLLSLPPRDVLSELYLRVSHLDQFAALLVAILSLIISRRLTRPLEDLKRGAQRFARGDLERKLPVPASEELGSLAEAMNQMAAQGWEFKSSVIQGALVALIFEKQK